MLMLDTNKSPVTVSILIDTPNDAIVFAISRANVALWSDARKEYSNPA